MTTEPKDLTRSINHERMPVLISDPADFEAVLERMLDSEQVDSQCIRASQKPYVPRGERKRRAQGS